MSVIRAPCRDLKWRRMVLFLGVSAALTGCGRQGGTLSPNEQRDAFAADIQAQFLPTDKTREAATIYATLYPIAAGVEISPAFNKNDISQPPPVYSPTRPSWFFVVDYNSTAAFAHDVVFIIAPTDGSAFAVHRERWWPVVEAQNHWYRRGHMDAAREFMVYEGVVAADWRAAGRVFP